MRPQKQLQNQMLVESYSFFKKVDVESTLYPLFDRFGWLLTNLVIKHICLALDKAKQIKTSY